MFLYQESDQVNLQPPHQDKNSPTNPLFSFRASKNDHKVQVTYEEDCDSLETIFTLLHF